jgi:exonuclease III
MNSPGTLLTWNVAGRTTLLDEQVERVLARDPDVLCLQEVTPATLPRWSAHLKRAGYHVAASALQPDTRRRLGVLVAGRLPFTCEEPLAAAPWPERLLAADLPLPDWAQTLHVVCLHAPIRKNPHQAKILTFEAVSASLAALDDGVPAILCGDLNAPQHEASDWTITTFGQSPKGTVRGGLGVREDGAERMILSGPSGWRDAFRATNDYESRKPSWKANRGHHPGYRLDHILVSPHLNVLNCGYDHSVRRDGLSDHSAMYATVAMASAHAVVA